MPAGSGQQGGGAVLSVFLQVSYYGKDLPSSEDRRSFPTPQTTSKGVPQTLLVAPYVHKKLSRLTMEELVQANSMLKSLKDQRAVLKYCTNVSTDNIDVLTFSDASFHLSKKAS